MIDRIARRERPPRSRLEGWLLRKLTGGDLRGLPRYQPLGCQAGQCAEQFARTLLTGLKTSEGDADRHERWKDDGRAFRSWAESVYARVA